jgi:hypothetical protein
MKKRTKIALGILGGMIGTVILFVVIFWIRLNRHYRSQVGPAIAFAPHCDEGDDLCATWAQARGSHPYTYQNVGIRRLPNGNVAILLFEPPPVLQKDALDEFLKATFADDFKSLKRLRWDIGTDGWVEDVALETRSDQKSSSDGHLDLKSDALLRDRIAILYGYLFGTTYGAAVDLPENASAPSSLEHAPSLSVSSLELRSWLTENGLSWYPVDDVQASPITWRELRSGNKTGTFVSTDNTLVALTFPTEWLLNAQIGGKSIDSLRVAFREFAVASDVILGALWTRSCCSTIFGRSRSTELSALPPLRFETFALLAAQSGDELAQSYERTAIFAGKLDSGDYEYKDWAPVYLSEPLIDTEFGALLNITDQILKSWSESGHVEYLYFSYPKPKSFPFPKPLSATLERESGSHSVLFNWNTAGSAVVVRKPEGNLLTTKQTGSLPVTYGADAKNNRSVQTGGLLKYEDTAYNYFSNLEDQNLERVVQYTLLYQLFRAIASDSTGASTTVSHPVAARSKSAQYLAEQTAKLLEDLQAGRLPDSTNVYKAEIEPKLAAFRRQYSTINDASLSRILADRQSQDAIEFSKTRREAFEKQDTELRRKSDALQADVDSFNDKVKKANYGGGPGDIDLDSERAKLTERDQALKQEQEALVNEVKKDPLEDIRFELHAIANRERDLDEIRKAYIELNRAEPKGSIKTPSVVLSWRGYEALLAVGGHNLDAHTLRLEQSTAVHDIEVVETNEGRILRYNPSEANQVESHASELARGLEHQGIEDANGLNPILSEQIEVRPRPKALQLEGTFEGATEPPERWTASIGSRVYTGRESFVGDLRTIAEQNDCCVFIANGQGEVGYAVEKSLHPPPVSVAIEIRDTASLNEFVKAVSLRKAGQGPKEVVFFDVPASHVDAVALGVAKGFDEASAGGAFDVAFVKELAKGNSSHVDAIEAIDLRGRPSLLKSLAEAVEAKGRELLTRMGVVESRVTWNAARVETLDAGGTEQLLHSAGWDTERDGFPTAVKLSFAGNGSGSLPPDATLVAGFEQQGLPNAQRLLGASEQARSAASSQGGSLAQYYLTVKNDLRQMPEVQVKRLLLVVHDGDTRVLFTWLDPDRSRREAS